MGRNEGPGFLLSICPKSSKKGRHGDQKLQYNIVKVSVANRRKPRLSWKRGCKGFRQEMVLEPISKEEQVQKGHARQKGEQV